VQAGSVGGGAVRAIRGEEEDRPPTDGWGPPVSSLARRRRGRCGPLLQLGWPTRAMCVSAQEGESAGAKGGKLAWAGPEREGGRKREGKREKKGYLFILKGFKPICLTQS